MLTADVIEIRDGGTPARPAVHTYYVGHVLRDGRLIDVTLDLRSREFAERDVAILLAHHQREDAALAASLSRTVSATGRTATTPCGVCGREALVNNGGLCARHC